MTPSMRISRARAGLVYSHPFFATLALGMGVVERPDIPTMATDGETLFYNAEFVAGLTDEELRGVIAHEVMHVVHLHHTRRGGRDPGDWNRAGDHAINLPLLAEGFRLPKGALADRQFEGMSADAIYARLRQPRDLGGGQQGQGQNGQQGGPQGAQGGPQAGASQPAPSASGQPRPGADGGAPAAQGGTAPDPGMCGGVIDAAPAHDTAAVKAAELRAKTRVIQAANVARAAGKLPGFAQGIVDEIRAPKIDIWSVLRRFVDECSRWDYAWSRPNRRHVAAGLYLPGRVPDGIQRLGVLIDTSGSVNMDAHATFLGELQGAIDDAQPQVVQVVQCDTRVHSVREYGPGEEIDRTVAGGGGTNMTPGLREFLDDCAAIVCFTDCRFSRPPDDPGVPVLWVKWGNGQAVPPFGEVIQI